MSIIILIITGIIIYLIIYIKNGSEKRKQQQIENEKKQEQQRREREEEQGRQRRIPGKQYDRIINCPVCFGSGKAIHAPIFEYEMDDNGSKRLKLQMDCVANKKNPQYDDVMTMIEYLEKMGYTFPDETIVGNIIKARLNFLIEDCKFCRGEGIAYAWFEKTQATTSRCTKCQGSGKISKQIKLDIGVGKTQCSCDRCNGIGQIQIPEKQIVHVQTLAGGMFNEEIDRIFPEYWEQFKMNRPFGIFYTKDDKTVGNGKEPFRFYTEITENNSDFFSKSRPRFS